MAIHTRRHRRRIRNFRRTNKRNRKSRGRKYGGSANFPELDDRKSTNIPIGIGSNKTKIILYDPYDKDKSNLAEFEYTNGDIYLGRYKQNTFNQMYIKEGYGRMIYKNNPDNYQEYSGQWVDNKKNGKGKMIYTTDNPDKYQEYDGEWNNDKKDGTGKMIYTENNPENYKEYNGEWYNDKKHGTGTFTYNNGNSKTSKFIDDYPVMKKQMMSKI